MARTCSPGAWNLSKCWCIVCLCSAIVLACSFSSTRAEGFLDSRATARRPRKDCPVLAVAFGMLTKQLYTFIRLHGCSNILLSYPSVVAIARRVVLHHHRGRFVVHGPNRLCATGAPGHLLVASAIFASGWYSGLGLGTLKRTSFATHLAMARLVP